MWTWAARLGDGKRIFGEIESLAVFEVFFILLELKAELFSKIVFTEKQVEHWLNDKKVLSFVPWSEEWYEKRNSGKWDNFPDYGKYKKGYIGLQDHGSDLWFRNVKIKKL